MNYSRIRAKTKKRLEEKKAQIAEMSGSDRAKLEQHIVDQCLKEELESEKLGDQLQSNEERPDIAKGFQDNREHDSTGGMLDGLQEKLAEVKSPDSAPAEAPAQPASTPAPEAPKQPQQNPQHKHNNGTHSHKRR